mmetsp:Transcript_149127/g.259027  ORF Transcript_149127/g.259027 Transcript_149127/m.259027 type:complete len:81 (+) Transcript_149127:253-495(+)
MRSSCEHHLILDALVHAMRQCTLVLLSSSQRSVHKKLQVYASSFSLCSFKSGSTPPSKETLSLALTISWGSRKDKTNMIK